MAACAHQHPTTPHTQPLPGITRTRFSLIRYRSPLHTESHLFSSPTGTEMFHFPASPPHRLCIHLQVTPHNWCGVSPFGHPRINASLATPRGITQPRTSFIGPACQGIHRTPLITQHTQTQHTKTQQTRRNHTTKHTPTPQRNKTPQHKSMLDQCSRPLSSSHTPHPRTTKPPNQQPHNAQIQAHTHKACCPRHPTACQHTTHPHPHALTTHTAQACLQKNGHTLAAPPAHHNTNAARVCVHPDFSTKHSGSHTHGDSTTTPHNCEAQRKKLLRKEVIQPHLPVRLPCYDFVPIADPTFDSSF